MPRKPTGKPPGRPVRDFDQKTFEGLCYVWCTFEEMENILQCDRHTLDNWCKRTYKGERFSEVYKRFADGGKASLRRNQLNMSKTNASMAIWLGKQKLDQKDEPKTIEGFNGELKEFIDFLKHKYARGKDDVQKDVPAGPAEESNGEGNTVL